MYYFKGFIPMHKPHRYNYVFSVSADLYSFNILLYFSRICYYQGEQII
jgi:hypothetical protein